MAASDTELESNTEDLLSDLTSNTVEEYAVRGRSVKRAHSSIDKIFDVMMKLRGLNSSKRGFSVGKIDRPG